MGSGHLMRCLTLAEELKKKWNSNIYFFSKSHIGNINGIIKEKNFHLVELPVFKTKNVNEDKNNLYGLSWLGGIQEEDAQMFLNTLNKITPDLLIIDHYGIDVKWENIVRPYVNKIMVIDDLANRLHNCDYLLDQNYYSQFSSRYDNLVPNKCKLFLGPDYVLLRDEFIEKRNLVRTKSKDRILIFFGAIDQHNITLTSLKAICLKDENNYTVDLVIGSQNPNKQQIKDYVKNRKNLILHVQIDNLSELMKKATIFIGAGGTAIWECCFLGLPSFIITFAENQILSVQYLEKMKIIKYYGHYSRIELFDLSQQISDFIKDLKWLKMLSQNSLRLIDGLGKKRISNKISYD